MSQGSRVRAALTVGAAVTIAVVTGSALQAGGRQGGRSARTGAPRTAQTPPPGEVPRTGQLQRIVLDDKWEEIRRGLTEEDDAAPIRFEPAAPAASGPAR